MGHMTGRGKQQVFCNGSLHNTNVLVQASQDINNSKKIKEEGVHQKCEEEAVAQQAKEELARKEQEV